MNRAVLRNLLLLDLALSRDIVDARAFNLLFQTNPDPDSGPADGLPERIEKCLEKYSSKVEINTLAAEVERLIGEAGDEERAIKKLGGFHRGVFFELDRVAPQLSDRLRSRGIVPRTPLRRVSPLRYLDLFPIGEGGMGAVYRAFDTELNRYVALKIVRPADDDSDVTLSSPLVGITNQSDPARDSRLLQEAWITSGMNHSGVVPVYEVGENEAGVPFYTMQLVEGDRTLADAILEADDLEARLSLLEPFLRICDTIAYAHSQGIVHRDLKTRNVALGPYGEVFVLDWGLAKRRNEKGPLSKNETHPGLTERSPVAHLKTHPAALGTPGYMAPEAAAGRPEMIDERSDIYSLGVILFEILTGALPFRFDHFEEYARRVAEETAPNASDVDPAVPIDLSLLCARSLSIDPKTRPRSSASIAGAIRTWQGRVSVDREVTSLIAKARANLDEIPGGAEAGATSHSNALERLDKASIACRRILAMRPENEEATDALEEIESRRKLVIDRRVRIERGRTLRRAFVASLIFVSIGLLVVAAMLREREQAAETARKLAVSERLRAEEVLAFLLHDLKDTLEPTGRLDLIAQVAKEAARYFESVPSEQISPETETLLITALGNLGDVFRIQGDLLQARQVYDKALAHAFRLEDAEKTDPKKRLVRATCEGWIADIIYAQGNRREALETWQEQGRWLRKLLSDGEEDPAFEQAFVVVAKRLGKALIDQGDWSEADTWLTAVVQSATHLDSIEPEKSRWKRELASAHMTRSHVLELQSDFVSAEVEAVRALNLARPLEAAHAADIRNRELLARAYTRLGSLRLIVAKSTRSKVESIEPLRQGLILWRRLASLEPTHIEWNAQVARLELETGDLMLHRRDKKAAHSHFAKSLEIAEKLSTQDPSNADLSHLIVTLCDRLARTSDLTTGLEYRRRAVRSADDLLVLDPTNTMWRHIAAFTRSFLAGQLDKSGDSRTAIDWYLDSLAITETLIARYEEDVELHDLHLLSLECLSRILTETRQMDRAVSRARDGITHSDRKASSNPDSTTYRDHTIVSRLRLAEALATRNGSVGGDQEEAGRVAREALDRIHRAIPQGETADRTLLGAEERLIVILRDLKKGS